MNPTLEDLLPQALSESSPVAKVTRDCVVIRNPGQRFNTIVVLSRLSAMKRIRTSHPVLLVLAAGLFLVSAGAHFSRASAGRDPAPSEERGSSADLGADRESVALRDSSEDGRSVTIPIFLLGLAATAGYWLTRRAVVVFVTGTERVETASLSRSEAESLIAEVQSTFLKEEVWADAA